jgi:7-cyano-7-deazaguanine synthase
VTTIVLLSGGLDSAVLLALESQRAEVHPVYVSVGLAWEHAEQTMLVRLLAAPVFNGRVLPLARLEFSMRDIYAPTHWAVRGVPPSYDTPDEDVYLAGRNLVLLTKAGVVAGAVKAVRIVLGTLSDNPFPDATPDFYSAMARALSLGLNHTLEIAAPLAAMHKEDAIRLGLRLGVPLEYTLSCMNPRDGQGEVQQVQQVQEVQDSLPLHCGLCSKCRERRDAFAAAGVPDPTPYAHESPRQ